MTTRREFIKQCAAGGALAHSVFLGRDLPAERSATAPTAAGAERRQFEKAQQNLLSRYGLAARSRFLKLDRPPLMAHVLEAGRGAPVLLLHGGGSTACSFVPLMGPLQKQFQLFAPDRPGCGLTDAFDYRGVPFRQHAVDFVSSLLDALRLPRVAIIGNSMGGYWALLFALAAPERVTRLVLIGGVAGSSPPPLSPRPQRTRTSLEGTRARLGGLVADANRLPREILEAEYAAALLPGASLGWNSMLEQVEREGALRLGLAYALRPELKHLKPPALFIWGDKDFEGPPSLAEEMAAIAPHGRCEVVPDAGHLPWLDQPEHCTQLTSAFLKDGKRR